jgi:hypothetical protein
MRIRSQLYLSSLDCLTSTRPKSLSLSSGITGKVRKKRMEKGDGGKLPKSATVCR